MSTNDRAAKPETAPPALAATPAEAEPIRPARPCPNCGKMSVAASYPFCSKRCRMVDLNRWLTGVYAIPVRPEEETEDDGE